ncbi:hypothetical protein HDU76_006584 [Blyttiomyces sp. JEL0837]|nr:hypothetical protein HDU76_006584 [Blyttiomyces sp. JEL0837]
MTRVATLHHIDLLDKENTPAAMRSRKTAAGSGLGTNALGKTTAVKPIIQSKLATLTKQIQTNPLLSTAKPSTRMSILRDVTNRTPFPTEKLKKPEPLSSGKTKQSATKSSSKKSSTKKSSEVAPAKDCHVVEINQAVPKELDEDYEEVEYTPPVAAPLPYEFDSPLDLKNLVIPRVLLHTHPILFETISTEIEYSPDPWMDKKDEEGLFGNLEPEAPEELKDLLLDEPIYIPTF